MPRTGAPQICPALCCWPPAASCSGILSPASAMSQLLTPRCRQWPMIVTRQRGCAGKLLFYKKPGQPCRCSWERLQADRSQLPELLCALP